MRFILDCETAKIFPTRIVSMPIINKILLKEKKLSETNTEIMRKNAAIAPIFTSVDINAVTKVGAPV